MKRFLPILFVVSVLFVLSVPSSANVFDLGPGLTNLETVTVRDPGNTADTSAHSGNPAGQGSVSYAYNIGKYEVTAGQYCDFLNKIATTDSYGLYNTKMWSDSHGCKIEREGNAGSYTYSVAADWANRPVNYVSYWDACRFANWLHNGQPTGPQNASTTEDGAYFINGYNGDDGRAVQRKADWKWAVTSEDEWYKAAYYKGGGANAGYWDYPMRSSLPTAPSNQITNPDDGNNANFRPQGGSYTIGAPYYRTLVGEFENSESAYGTFDQGGNVTEWNEAVLSFGRRGMHGGYYGGIAWDLRSVGRGDCQPDIEYTFLGFRVAQAVPEPSSLMILAGGIGMILGIRRRRA